MKVLIINDSRFERKILKDQVRNLGYEVMESDENVSLGQLDKYCPNVIIANRIMNSILGEQLIEKIKSERPHIRCLLSSCSPIHLNDYRNRKVDDVLRTPISMGDLEKLLSNKEQMQPDNISEQISSLCPFCGISLQGKDIALCPNCGGIL